MANNVPKSYLDDELSAIRKEEKDSLKGSSNFAKGRRTGKIPQLSLPGRSSHDSGSIAEMAASTGTAH